MDVVSALGYSLGYLGGGILFALNVWMTLRPETFGFSSVASGVQVSFLSVALWWAIFSIPLLLFVREPRSIPTPGTRTGGQGFKSSRPFSWRLAGKGRAALPYRLLALYRRCQHHHRHGCRLWLVPGIRQERPYSGAAHHPVCRVSCGDRVWQAGEKLGTKKSIFIGLGMYVLVCVWVSSCIRRRSSTRWRSVSSGSGGVQSLSRSFYAKIIPPESAGAFSVFMICWASLPQLSAPS